MIPDKKNDIYLMKEKNGFRGFTDIVMLNNNFIIDENLSFGLTEECDNTNFLKKYGPMRFIKNPFVMYLPNVIIFRDKKTFNALGFLKNIFLSGVYPYTTLSDNELKLFRDRALRDTPLAEKWLDNIYCSKPYFYRSTQAKLDVKNVIGIVKRRFYK